MESLLPLLPLLVLGLTVIFVVTQFVMLILIMRSIESHKKDHIGDERMNTELRGKSEGILQSAQSKANDILANAEKQGVEILAHEQESGNILSKEFHSKMVSIEETFTSQLEINAKDATKKLDEMLTQAAHAVNDHIGQTDKQFTERAEEVRKKADEIVSTFTSHVSENEKLLNQKSEEMLKSSQEAIMKFASDTQEEVKKQLEGELTLAKEEIAQYKKSRLAIINERIVDMLEDVASVTLEKKLSMSDESELIYRSLEEARKEHGFGSLGEKK
jgi:vacuolar-type H+-ATPase subunit H